MIDIMDWVEAELKRSPELGITPIPDIETPAPTLSIDHAPVADTLAFSHGGFDRPEPLVYHHTVSERFSTPQGIFFLQRVDEDMWEVSSSTPSERLTPTSRMPRADALDLLRRIADGRVSSGRVARLQVSLKPSYDPHDVDCAYVESPEWAGKKYSVETSDARLMNIDGYAGVVKSPQPEEAHWYSFKRKRAMKEAEEWVLHLAHMRCIDCSENTSDEYYMVEDSVWNLSGVDGDDGMLCIGCMEERIGRTLTWEDFTDAPVNWSHEDTSKSSRLLQRLRNEQGFSRTDLLILNPSLNR